MVKGQICDGCTNAVGMMRAYCARFKTRLICSWEPTQMWGNTDIALALIFFAELVEQLKGGFDMDGSQIGTLKMVIAVAGIRGGC